MRSHPSAADAAWISWINVALGLWLVSTAFLFQHRTGTGITENIVTGLFVALAALWAARAFRPTVSLIASGTVALTGLWVLAAPFVLGYERESAAVGNDIAVGIVIIALGVTNTMLKADLRGR